MTINLPPKVVGRRGITLLELTIIVSGLAAIVSITLIGSRAWKRGSDKATCILTLRNIQMAARCYQSLYGYHDGGRPAVLNGSQDIAVHLLKKGYIEKDLHDRACGQGHCPSGGRYTRGFPDLFPKPGELYMKCSLSAKDGHKPGSSANW